MFLRSVAIASAVIAAAGVALYFAIRLAVFGELNPDQLDWTSVPRIRISAEAVVSGQPVSGEWTVPAVKHWGPPQGWLGAGRGSFRTIRSPFDTLFLRLPTGGGLGVDLRQVQLDVTWRWRPATSPVERSRTLYYLLDSIDRPRVLIDYAHAAQGSSGCPKDDLILGCKVSSTTTLLGAGPLKIPSDVGGSDLLAYNPERYEEIRRFGLEPPKPMIFVYARADFSPLAIFSDPDFEPLLRTIVRPTILWIDQSAWRRLPDRRSSYVNLTYEGSKTWRADIDHKTSFPAEGPNVYRLTDELKPNDLRCCSWPDMLVKDDRMTAILGTIRYRGELLSFGTGSTGQIPLLVDPDRRTVVTFLGPMAKVIWMMPSR